MKHAIKTFSASSAVMLSLLLYSCDKQGSISASPDSTESSAIVVAASATAASSDSVEIEHSCGRGGSRDSIAESALPDSVGSYLNANYAGYTFHKAFAVKDSADAITGYVVVIYFEDKPVGLQFDSEGNFESVLRQRHGRGRGRGHGEGR